MINYTGIFIAINNCDDLVIQSTMLSYDQRLKFKVKNKAYQQQKFERNLDLKFIIVILHNSRFSTSCPTAKII